MNTTEQKFDLEYFIAKFETIPEDQWTTGVYYDRKGCKCAYGHCGYNDSGDGSHSLESLALDKLVSHEVVGVNDGESGYLHFGSTPKQRVVNYLKSLR